MHKYIVAAIIYLCFGTPTLADQTNMQAGQSSEGYSCIETTNNANNLCTKANQLAEARRYDEAKAAYEQASKLDPNNSSALVHGDFAIMLQNLGDIDGAIAEFNKALQFDSKSEWSKKGLASALSVKTLQLKEASLYDKAKPLCEQACILDPDSGITYYNLASLYELQGQLTEAIIQYNKALNCKEKVPIAMLAISNCYQQEGNINEATSYLKKFIDEYPCAPEVNIARKLLSRDKTWSLTAGDASDKDYFKSVVLEGVFKWPTQKPINVFIEQGSAVAGYRDSLRQILIDSFSDWIKALHDNLSWRLVSRPTDANIICAWTSSGSQFKQMPDGTEGGETFIEPCPIDKTTGAHMIEHVHIGICTMTPDIKQSLSDRAMKSVCLHEIGHALGLNGHSANNQDVMFFSMLRCPPASLSARDKATISRLYSF